LQASATGGGGSYSYNWAGGPASGTYMVTHTAPGTSIYTVTVIDQNGCSGNASIQVTSMPGPTITANSVTICQNAVASLIVSGASSYVWLPGGNTNSTFTILPVNTTTYTVTGSASNGCSDSKIVSVTLAKCASVQETFTTRGNVLIYPNPNFGELIIETDRTIHVTVYDLTGKVVVSAVLETGKSLVPVHALNAGLYFIKCIDESTSYDSKIMKLE
jgi:hypothetical protein